MDYYLKKAQRDFWLAVLCWCAAALLAALCVAGAYLGTACWAVACACCSVFLWHGAAVFAHDAGVNRRKASWF